MGPLRVKADWRSVAVLLAVSATFLTQWFVVRSFQPLLFTLSVLLSLQVAVVAHNHNHSPLWNNRWLNIIQGYWFTFFYGLPLISWLAVHNRSHHGHHNKAELDCTSTHNVGDRNDLWGLLLYTPASTSRFWREHGTALSHIYRRSRREFAFHLSHLVLLWGSLALALFVDWRKALLYLVLPQQIAIASITVFNFCQHAHADTDSKYNVARNFMSPILNNYLFNCGYHTAHHLNPKLHWSQLPAAQARLTPLIDPRLNERSFWRYCFRVVVMGTFSKRHRSEPLYS